MACITCGAGLKPGTAAIIYPGGSCRGCVCEGEGKETCVECHEINWKDTETHRTCLSCDFTFPNGKS